MAICSSVSTLNCTWSVSVGAGSHQNVMFPFERLLALSIQLTREGGVVMKGERHDWKESVFHFVMWFLFSLLGWSLTAGQVPFTWIYYFFALRKLMNSNLCCVCTCWGLCVCAREQTRHERFCSSGNGTFMAISDLAASQFDRAMEPEGGGRDGEIMEMEGERRLTQSLMSFLHCLSLFLGQGPCGWGCGWT